MSEVASEAEARVEVTLGNVKSGRLRDGSPTRDMRRTEDGN